jgi:putative transposase
MPRLSHRIALSPTLQQAEDFKRACGPARFVWNWALGQYAAELRPNVIALKKQCNTIKDRQFLWLADAHLIKVWWRYVTDSKVAKQVYAPRFKKKCKCRDSFYVADDRLLIFGMLIRLPNIGEGAMDKTLRCAGKILGATVSRTADRRFVALPVDVPDHTYDRTRTKNGIVGVDRGVQAAATLSTDETIHAPKSQTAALRRPHIRSRRLSRNIAVAPATLALKPHAPLPKGTNVPICQHRVQATPTVARLYACIDIGFGKFRTQRVCKVQRYGSQLTIADRFNPISRLCAACVANHEALTLSDRRWACPILHTGQNRDYHAADNLARLATETTLPVARSSGNGETLADDVRVAKVTPVRYDCVVQSRQEQNRAYIRVYSGKQVDNEV